MAIDNTINTQFFSHTGADDVYSIDVSRTYSFKPIGGPCKLMTQSMTSGVPADEVEDDGIEWPEDQPYSNGDSADRAQYHERIWIFVPTGTTLIGDRQVN